MRDSAQRQEPLMLINGQGNVLGRFVITQIEESQNTFWRTALLEKLNLD